MADKKVTSFSGTLNEKAIDKEICAMRDVASALEPLFHDARLRVLAWIEQRLRGRNPGVLS